MTSSHSDRSRFSVLRKVAAVKIIISITKSSRNWITIWNRGLWASSALSTARYWIYYSLWIN